jgi:DNA-binding transcriptional MocR family regulator
LYSLLRTLFTLKITYPGVRSICAKLGLQLIGVDMDSDGVIPKAIEEAIRRHAPKAIYLNPTLQNPMTITIPERRRAAICSLAAAFRSLLSRTTPTGSFDARPPAPRGHRA